MRFKKPTLEEVKAYVREGNWHLVDPVFFWHYFEANEWHDANDKPVKRWKGKVVTWHYQETKKAGRCRLCNNHGVYMGGYDDTGQKCWYCEKHKPKQEPILPKEITGNVFKKVPSIEVNVSDARNRELDKLGM